MAPLPWTIRMLVIFIACSGSLAAATGSFSSILIPSSSTVAPSLAPEKTTKMVATPLNTIASLVPPAISSSARGPVKIAADSAKNGPYTFPNGSVITDGPGSSGLMPNSIGSTGRIRTSVATVVPVRATTASCSEMYAACITAEPSQSSLFASRQKACFTPRVDINFKDAKYTSTGNNTCANAQGTRSDKVWDTVNAGQALDQFLDLWTNNKLYCDECRGLFKCECPAGHQTACNQGLRDAAKDKDGNLRIDIALSLWSGWSVGDAVRCGVNGNQCDSLDCSSVYNSAPVFIVMKGLVHFSSYLDSSYKQLMAANSKADEWKQKFQELFAPVKKPDNSGRAFAAALLAAVSGGIGFLPEFGKVAKDLGSAVAIAGGMAAWPTASEGKPADFGPAISNITTWAAWGMGNLSHAMFQEGSFHGPDHNLSLTDLLHDGQLVKMELPVNWTDGFVDMWQRQIFQQLGVVAWGTDDSLFPFITFTEGSCNDVDWGNKLSSPFPDEAVPFSKIMSRIDHDGKCIWLVNARPITGKTKRDSLTDESKRDYYDLCMFVTELPGLSSLKSSDFGGLSMADFIIPSYQGWKQNNYHNGFDMLGSKEGQFVPDPQAPGALNIPVCDIMTDPKRPGIGCPIFDQPANGKRCEAYKSYGDASSALIVTPNNGIYAPGTCQLKLSLYQIIIPDKLGNIDNNPLKNWYELMVRVADAEGKFIGGAAKAPIDDNRVWQVWNSSLPFDILIKGPNPNITNDPFEIWYGDQHWKGNDQVNGKPRCEGGWGAWGTWDLIDEIHCNFDCPAFKEGDPKPKSSIEQFPLPNGHDMQPVVPFGDKAVNLYSEKVKPGPDSKADPRKYQDPAKGKCILQVRQWDYGHDGVMSWYQYEPLLIHSSEPNNPDKKVTYDTNFAMAPFANSMQPIPPEYVQDIYGRKQMTTVSFPADNKEWPTFRVDREGKEPDIFRGDDTKAPHNCVMTDWAQSHRRVECTIDCD